MSPSRDRDPPVSTVYLGRYTWDHANEIAGELEEAGIVWWYKQPGFLSQAWESGVRLFVDRTRLDEARDISDRIAPDGTAKRRSGPPKA